MLQEITQRVDMRTFERFKFAIVTAGYASLREQTKKRMLDCGLSGPCWISNPKAVPDVVAFLQEVVKTESASTLFVMICDEV